MMIIVCHLVIAFSVRRLTGYIIFPQDEEHPSHPFLPAPSPQRESQERYLRFFAKEI